MSMPTFRIFRPYGANHIFCGTVEAADRPAARELGWAMTGGNRRIEAFLPDENPDDDVADARGGLDECAPGVAASIYGSLARPSRARTILSPTAFRAACDAVAAGIGALLACDERDLSAHRRILQDAVGRLGPARLARRDLALTDRSAELLWRSTAALADSYERRRAA